MDSKLNRLTHIQKEESCLRTHWVKLVNCYFPLHSTPILNSFFCVLYSRFYDRQRVSYKRPIFCLINHILSSIIYQPVYQLFVIIFFLPEAPLICFKIKMFFLFFRKQCLRICHTAWNNTSYTSYQLIFYMEGNKPTLILLNIEIEGAIQTIIIIG